MDFDFSDQQKLLQGTARKFLEGQGGIRRTRTILEGAKPIDAELWQRIAELGWTGTAMPEELGGAGYGHLELALLAQELGRVLAPIPFACSVYLAMEGLRLAGSEEQRAQELPRLASGEAIGAFALAECPGEPDLSRVETEWKSGKLTGRKIAVAGGQAATHALVVAKGDGGISFVWVDLGARGVERQPVESLDPTRGVATLAFDETPSVVLGRAGRAAPVLAELLDRAAVLLAFEQLGAAQRALELTLEYTTSRYAFGRPVASFQALKHRLVDVYAEIELARSNCYYGAWALAAGDPALATAAPCARISATTCFERAAKEMIQMHGGLGFTWEADCHLFYRRSKFDALALGSTRQWREWLIQRLEKAAREGDES